MSQRSHRVLWALGIVACAGPLQAVVIHAVPTCVLCGDVPGIGGAEVSSFNLEASLSSAVFELSTGGTGGLDINDTSVLLRVFGGMLIEEGGVVVPSSEHPSSALQGGVFESAACQDCGTPAPAAQSPARIGFGFPLVAIITVLLIAIAVPLFYLVRYLRSLDVEEAYLKERWGVRSKMD